MSIAAIGVGTVGTFAWYEVNTHANIGQTAANSGTLQAQASNANVGAFTIRAAVTPTAGVTLDLTDDTGACKVYVGGVLSPATAKGNTIQTYVVTAQVTYSGAETLTAAQCQDLWEDALGANKVYITATTAQTRFKFGSSDTDYSHAAGDMVRNVANATALAWEFDQTYDAKANHATVATIELGRFYVSIDGADGGTPDESGPSGTITFTPSVAA